MVNKNCSIVINLSKKQFCVTSVINNVQDKKRAGFNTCPEEKRGKGDNKLFNFIIR